MIPHSAARRYALDVGLDADMAYELWEVIHHLDLKWLEAQSSKLGQGGESGGKKPGGGLSDQDIRGPVRRGKRKSDS